jgi:glyoxylase-like metal-dependent hydrolase (beta-lactamase superfamily II)
VPPSVDRRTFLHASASCAGYLAALAPGMPRWFRSFRTARVESTPVTQEPWGRLERVGDGLWALISTPLDGDRTTLCNGGIIAGRDGVLVVESFASPRGAEWMARQARDLAGRWPSRVVLTHFHGDHANGVEGFAGTRRRSSMPRARPVI